MKNTRQPPGWADILLPVSQIRDEPGDSDRARRCRAAGRAQKPKCERATVAVV